MRAMTKIVFVAPFLLESTLRFIEAACSLPGVEVGLVSQDPVQRIPEALRPRLSEHLAVADALDPQRIAEAVRTLSSRMGGIDRLLGTLEELQVPLGEVRSTLGIVGMRGETAQNFRDKARMKDILQQAGLPCARHRRVSSRAEAWAFATEVGYPLIVKPTAGSGSRNTFRVEDEERLREVLSWGSPSSGQTTMIEEFITGDEYSFDSVFLNGKLVWYSINHYYPGCLEVLENNWIQWAVVLPREADDPVYDRIRHAAEQSLKALGMYTGLSHMEWFKRKNGDVVISEVGARPPGAQFTTLISYAHDINFYNAWARLMVFDEFDPPGRPYAAGIAFLRGQGSGRIKAIHGVQEAARDVGGVAVDVKLPVEGTRTTGTYDGDGFVLVRHPETQVVEQALERIVSQIRVEVE
jgi:predicted ATP-grasp superfamily ATP-dependent carboligase